MSKYLVLLSCLLVISTVRAEKAAKPISLTAKEIAAGWILLFDGETTFGWNLEGDVKVENGKLIVGGEKRGKATFTTTFPECTLEIEYQTRGKEKGVVFLGHSSATLISAKDKAFWITGSLTTQADEASLFYKFRRNSDQILVGSSKYQKPPSAWSLAIEAPENTLLDIRSMKLKSLETIHVFNGKDLSGWKEHPGKKTKFTVTKEGWLHLQEGPGDLQTEDQWDNFILQAECKTNGDKLNSGIFFRCRPGEYQQGYEAQIHNGFTPKPEKEYGIEEYDPKTNKLITTKKVKYTAQDYGTGGIYRRVPAHREVAKDKEWFTMTVVAQGRHVATWVNGIQVVDWTDYRPEKDNARNGCRLEKGPISLQGHDPTTDLYFRNIRIAELPRR
jgi:hypothetical protein